MSNYPEEIVKQAEKLIKQHGGDPIKDTINGVSISVLNQVARRQAIKAAIVSCKFAYDSQDSIKGAIGHEETWLTEKQRLIKIQQYLEGLL